MVSQSNKEEGYDSDSSSVYEEEENVSEAPSNENKPDVVVEEH